MVHCSIINPGNSKSCREQLPGNFPNCNATITTARPLGEGRTRQRVISGLNYLYSNLRYEITPLKSSPGDIRVRWQGVTNKILTQVPEVEAPIGTVGPRFSDILGGKGFGHLIGVATKSGSNTVHFLYRGKFILSLNRGVTKSGVTKSGSDCTNRSFNLWYLG
eukprot:sb/3472686/